MSNLTTFQEAQPPHTRAQGCNDVLNKGAMEQVQHLPLTFSGSYWGGNGPWRYGVFVIESA